METGALICILISDNLYLKKFQNLVKMVKEHQIHLPQEVTSISSALHA
jgi:hypothetical protein